MSYFRKRRPKGKNKGKKKKQKKGLGILKNRRKPSSNWVSIGDIWDNLKERYYCWSRRVPEGSILRWNSKGKIVGHNSRAKKPW